MIPPCQKEVFTTDIVQSIAKQNKEIKTKGAFLQKKYALLLLYKYREVWQRDTRGQIQTPLNNEPKNKRETKGKINALLWLILQRCVTFKLKTYRQVLSLLHSITSKSQIVSFRSNGISSLA